MASIRLDPSDTSVGAGVLHRLSPCRPIAGFVYILILPLLDRLTVHE